MKRLSIFSTLVVLLATMQIVNAQSNFPILNPESCTSIMVGKKASANGTVITSHTCDSYYRTWVDIVPAQDFEDGAQMEIFKSRLNSETINGHEGMTSKGFIPQVKHTFRFVDTAYPCLNEKQLGIGETTVSGRRALVNPDGMFMIEELERVALQRCTTARQAIALMGELVKEYGYGDWGECLTIADKNEVWHFEVFGEGPKKIGGVWAAVRIPDDEVGVSANISRISNIDKNDPENYMYSENVFSVAKKLGYWDGKEPFCFWKAYSGGNYSGQLKAFSTREFYILNKIAPSLHLSYDAAELPISVKPDKKLSAQDVMDLLMETYEGSEFDVTKNLKVEVKQRGSDKVESVVSPAANPWMNRATRTLLNTLKPGAVQGQRLVAVPQCAYSTVIELDGRHPDAIGGVLWLGFDNPGQSPRIPVFCGTTDLPSTFDVCGQPYFNERAIVWSFRKANKLSTVRWGDTKADILGGVKHFQDKGKRELPFVRDQYMQILNAEGEEAANAYLTQYTCDFAGAAAYYWERLADKFWKKFEMGF